jgi:hypothetical protein
MHNLLDPIKARLRTKRACALCRDARVNALGVGRWRYITKRDVAEYQ